MIEIRRGIRLAFDVGTVRIGVARCDQEALLCVPVATISSHDEAVALIEEVEPLEIVIGLPVSLDGSEQRAAQQVRRWAASLAERVQTPIRLIDERMTSASAGRDLASAGLSTRASRGVVDQAAAVIILEHALETERRTGEPGGVEL